MLKSSTTVRKRSFSLYRDSVHSERTSIEGHGDAFRNSDLEALLDDLREPNLPDDNRMDRDRRSFLCLNRQLTGKSDGIGERHAFTMINKRLIKETFLVVEQNTQSHHRVIQEAEFVGEHKLFAQNVTFPRKSRDFDLKHSHKLRRYKFVFTLRLIGQLFPAVINHKLNTLTKTMRHSLHRAHTAANLPATSDESLFSIQIPSICGFKDSIDRHQGT